MLGARYNVSLQNLHQIRFCGAYPKILREGRGLGTFGTRPKKCPRCKKHCSRNPKRYEGMPPKEFSKIQNDFFDTVFKSTFLFAFFFKF